MGSFCYICNPGQRTVLVILTPAQVSGGQRWLWQCTSPDMHVQLVQTSTSHCSLELYTVPWYKHDALESKTHRGTHTLPHTLEANMLSVLAGCHTLALVAAFPWNLHLFLTIWTLYRWTLFNATLNVAQLRKKRNTLQILLQYEYSLQKIMFSFSFFYTSTLVNIDCHIKVLWDGYTTFFSMSTSQ